MIKLKLCGIRRDEDIEILNRLSKEKLCPDWIGFVLAQGYRRTISPEQAAELYAKLESKNSVKAVGVFINQSAEYVAASANRAGLKVCQMHGDEDERFIQRLRKLYDGEIWKAVRVRTAEDILVADKLSCDKLLLDSFSESSYGGTGKKADWELIKSVYVNKKFFLAGGINADNLNEACEKIHPYGIDISGGTETDGVKDEAKIRRILEIMRRYGKEQICCE